MDIRESDIVVRLPHPTPDMLPPVLCLSPLALSLEPRTFDLSLR